LEYNLYWPLIFSASFSTAAIKGVIMLEILERKKFQINRLIVPLTIIQISNLTQGLGFAAIARMCKTEKKSEALILLVLFLSRRKE